LMRAGALSWPPTRTGFGSGVAMGGGGGAATTPPTTPVEPTTRDAAFDAPEHASADAGGRRWPLDDGYLCELSNDRQELPKRTLTRALDGRGFHESSM
jgi:hypothetical protein